MEKDEKTKLWKTTVIVQIIIFGAIIGIGLWNSNLKFQEGYLKGYIEGWHEGWMDGWYNGTDEIQSVWQEGWQHCQDEWAGKVYANEKCHSAGVNMTNLCIKTQYVLNPMAKLSCRDVGDALARYCWEWGSAYNDTSMFGE